MEPLFTFITVAVIIALLWLLYVLTPRSTNVRFLRGGVPFPLPQAPPPPDRPTSRTVARYLSWVLRRSSY
jgi:hypothetical protein